MREEAAQKAQSEPILGSYFHATILNHKSLGDALSFRLASKLDNPMLPTMLIRDVISEAMESDASLLSAAEIEHSCHLHPRPRLRRFVFPVSIFQGLSRSASTPGLPIAVAARPAYLGTIFPKPISVTLGVDIHPAAQLGSGIMFDHATGIVIGETAVVEDDVLSCTL